MDDRNPRWQRYLRLWGPDPDADLREEFRFHLETEVEELVARGVPVDEARDRALRRFGDLRHAAAACRVSDAKRLRRLRWSELADTVRHDVRYTVRGLIARPAFTATIVLTLALGVGANAAVFTIVDRVFLRPPEGVRDPASLHRLYTLDSRPKALVDPKLSLPEALDIQRAVGGEFPTAVYASSPKTEIEFGRDARRIVSVAWVTPNFFNVLGVRPAVGRDLDESDSRLGEPAEAGIISWTLWRREFGGDRDAVGRTVHVGGRPVTIVGIAPPGFTGIDIGASDIWLPLGGYTGIQDGTNRWYDNRGWAVWHTVTRVPAGATVEQVVERARTALRNGYREHRTAFPTSEQFGDSAVRVGAGSIIAARGPERLSHEMLISVVLAGVAGLVLVIAAANAGNLLLGRALQRRRETALRLALGIRRRRLVGQILLESLVISLLSAIAAMLMARWVGGALRGLLLPDIQWPGAWLDGRVALFALLISAVGGIIAGAVALRETVRTDPGMALKGTARDGDGRRSRMRDGLLAVQAALSLVLLAGTGLFGRTMYNIRNIDLGHELPGLIVVSPRTDAMHEKLPALAELARSLPGVTRVSGTEEAPLEGRTNVEKVFTRAGDTVVLRRGAYLPVEPGYLATVGTRIIRGRDLSPGDDAGGAHAIVVSEELERRLSPDRSAVGECLRLRSPTAPCYTIVGIAENANAYWLIEAPNAVMYVPIPQAPRRAAVNALVVRTAGDPAAVVSRLRQELGDTIPIAGERAVTLLAESLAPQYRPWELGAKIFSSFAALAVVLAALGIYSVLAYLVTLRRHELGVRLALGATGSRVVRLVVGDGLRQVAVGIAAGTACVLLGAALLEPLLYEVSPRDPAVIASAVAILLVGALAAALVPARRAVRTDPMIALREE